MMARARLFAVLPAVLMLCAVLSCCGGHEHADMRSPAETDALAALDDSMAVNSSRVPAMIRHGLASADDSLTYYDYYLRLMRYSVQQDVPDAGALQWDRAYNYLSRQERTPRTDGMMGFLLNVKGSYYHKLHYEPRFAIHDYNEAYRRLQGSDMEHRLPDVCANLGDAYVAANDMPHAAWWYRRALFLADSLQLPDEGSVSLYMGLGRIYLNLGDHDSALDCYKTADARFGLMTLNMQLYFLTNYGNYYYYTENYEASARVFRRMEKLLVDNGMQDSYEMYLCKINMADLCLNLGRTAESRRLLDEAYSYFSRIGDATAVYYCHTIAIGLALTDGDTAAVKRILDNEDVTTTVDFNMVNIRQRYLHDYYLRRGDYKSAYTIVCDSIVRNDSLKHNAANMRASEIMMRYTQDTLQLHHSLVMQAKDADIRTARLWLYVGVLAVIVMGLLLLWGYTYSRKRRLQLHMQLMQLRLVNVRSRLSPHFIFNVLNNRMAKFGGGDADELMSLVKLIRANLNMSGKYYVSLKDELDFVRYYVSVERSVLDGELDFVINAPDDSITAGVMVPSMFIQILVENSIKHGLKGRAGSKKLHISVAVDDSYCRITVADNGTGFDIRRSNPASTKTGMKVIRNTINIINHENKRKIRLGIRNVEAGDGSVAGCEVTLDIPLGLKTVWNE